MAIGALVLIELRRLGGVGSAVPFSAESNFDHARECYSMMEL